MHIDPQLAVRGSQSRDALPSRELIDIVAQFATSYVENNPTRLEDIPSVFQSALSTVLAIVEQLPATGVTFGGSSAPVLVDAGGLGAPLSTAQAAMAWPANLSPPRTSQKPAVPPSESIFDEYLVCLEDGRRLKTLRKHLGAKFNMTPDEYRQKWGLPPDYPMACKEFSEKRRELAQRHSDRLAKARQKALSARGKRSTRKRPSP